jgi:glycosyltransferase involved in cell wall biosynthesis
MPEVPPSILGISFDGLAISGIVNEFLNVAAFFRTRGLRVLLDLGYDITVGRTKDLGYSFLPPWVEPVRSIGYNRPKTYDVDLIEEAISLVRNGTTIAAAKVYDDVCYQLAALLVRTFQQENVRVLVVENGTLPDNPLFTEALYLAIAEYGVKQNLGKYVLWRDHDLMWSAEPHLYGSYPYLGVRKPQDSQYVHYAVSTAWMRARMLAWAPSGKFDIIPNRFFSPGLQRESHPSIRAAYGIPQDAYLVARCTRVVPQKCIERDLRFLDVLQARLAASGDKRRIFLFVTGPTQEDVLEFERLKSLESTLSIAGQVIWADGMLPFSPFMIDSNIPAGRFSVGDLLHEANLSSFLTSYDYEGFGNPPGESMAMGVPFIATTYELYHEVYGSKGAIAPLLPIKRYSLPSEPISDAFIVWTLRVLTDAEYRAQIVARNLEVCQRFYSLAALDQ